jgi:glyoxylase I family protein
MTATTTTDRRVTGIGTFHGVRYIVRDVAKAMEFYTEQLGFILEHKSLPAFATVSLGPLKLHLSGPDASGSRALPENVSQTPGGSNRVVIRVADLDKLTEDLRGLDIQFRNDMEVGPGGKQIQILDPDKNAIELFEPAK